jgi:hypothetical protein
MYPRLLLFCFVKRWIRILNLLVLVLAESAVALDPPLKLQSCELYLKSPIGQFTSNENLLGRLRLAKLRILEAIPSSESNEFDLEDVEYIGPIGGLDKDKAGDLVKQINGIERDLMASNPENKIFGFSIQGREKIGAALAVMDEQEKNLHKIYERELQRLNSETKLPLKTAATLFAYLWPTATLLMGLDMVGTRTIHHPYAFLSFGFMTYWYARNSLKYQAQRFDWSYAKIRGHLQQVAADAKSDDILVSSVHTDFPAEFHSMLMATSGQQDAGRRAGVRRWGHRSVALSFVWNMKGLVWRILSDWSVSMDHVIFVEEHTGEPVWLFFYRAERMPRFGSVRRSSNLRPLEIPGAQPANLPQTREMLRE